MKKNIIILLTLFIVLITGCTKEKNNLNFKNPKTMTFKDTQGQITLTYEDDGTFEYIESENVLKNEFDNFRYALSFGTNTIEQQEKIKEKMNKDTYEIIDNVEFNGYKGYVAIDKKYATATVFLYVDKKEDITIIIKVSPVQSIKSQEKINTGANPKNVIYNLPKVQKTLKSVKYEK